LIHIAGTQRRGLKRQKRDGGEFAQVIIIRYMGEKRGKDSKTTSLSPGLKKQRKTEWEEAGRINALSLEKGYFQRDQLLPMWCEKGKGKKLPSGLRSSQHEGGEGTKQSCRWKHFSKNPLGGRGKKKKNLA